MGSSTIELHGSGVHALRALALRAGDSTLGKQNDSDDSAALSTAQLRHAAKLLRRLRSEDPTTPTLAALFKQAGGVHVRVASSDQDDSDAATVVSKEHAAYMEKRRKKLLRLDEEMRYGKLVRNVKSKTSANELEQFQKSTRQHLSIGANMIAARITAFIAMYMLGRSLTDNETTRVIIGLGGAIAMMVIEMVLYITRASKYEAIEREQQMQRPSVF